MPSVTFVITLLGVVLCTIDPVFSSDNPSDEDYERQYPMRGSDQIEISSTYFIHIALWSIAGAIIAIGSCLACCCLCCGKFCCKCSVCLPPKPKDFDSKNMCCSGSRHKTNLRVVILACSVLIVLSAIVGFVGNGLMSEGVKQFVDETVTTVEEFQAAANNITTSLMSIEEQLNETLTEFNNTINQVTAAAQKTQQIVYEIDLGRVFCIYIGFQFALTTAAVAIAAAILQKNKIFNVLIIMCFLSLFCMWWTFAIHTPLSIILDDLCETIHIFLTQARDNKNSPLSFLISCLDSGDYLPIYNDIQGILQQELNELNATMTAEYGYSFNPTLPSGNGTESSLISIIGFVSNILTQVDKEIQEHGGNPGAQLSDMLHKVSVLLGVSQTLLEFVKCSHLQELIKTLGSSICGQFVRGIVYIVISSGLIGVLTLPLTVCIILSSNRFDRHLEYIKSKLIVEFVCIVQAILGIVSCTTVGTGASYEALWIGVLNVVIAIIGFVGTRMLKKPVIMVYAVLDTVLCILCTVIAILLGLAASSCTEPDCASSEKLGMAIALFYILLGLFPIILGVVSSWFLIKRFADVGVQKKIFDELAPLTNTFDE